MAETHEEQPPKYSPGPENHAQISSTAVETAPPAITTGAVVITLTGDCEGRQNIVNHCTVESGAGQNTTGDCITGKLNASYSFSGFIDILYKNKKLPWSCEKNLLYQSRIVCLLLCKFGLLHNCCYNSKRRPCFSLDLHYHLFNWLYFCALV